MTTARKHTPPVVRLACSDDVSTITTTLSSAFADDPLVAWFLGSPNRASERLAPVFRAMSATALDEAGHEVHVGGDGRAAALWRDVDRWKSSTGHQLRLMPGIWRAFHWRTGVVLRTHSLVERHHPEAPHRYLECLGTSASAQGQGLGAAVLGVMLDRCDDDGIAVFAESSNPRNLAFYHRHGFVRLGDELRLHPTAPPIIPIWRDPR